MAISFGLTGKTILVTGASSGIGQSVAINAAAAGAFVVLTGRNEERLQQTADQIAAESGDGKCALEPYDLTADLDDIPKWVRRLAKKYGAFSGLVHSAGISNVSSLRGVRASGLQKMFAVNSVTAIMLTKGLSLTGCFDERGASVVFMSSIAAEIRRPSQLTYAMSKAALDAAARTLGAELASDKIRVNTIRPGKILTPMVENGVFATLGEDGIAEQASHYALGCDGRPEDVAGMAIYLLSDASRFVTACSFNVDGGYH